MKQLDKMKGKKNDANVESQVKRPQFFFSLNHSLRGNIDPPSWPPEVTQQF